MLQVARSYGVATQLVHGDDLDHVVAAFLIDPEGRIAKRYLGLEHDPERILADLRELLL